MLKAFLSFYRLWNAESNFARLWQQETVPWVTVSDISGWPQPEMWVEASCEEELILYCPNILLMRAQNTIVHTNEIRCCFPLINTFSHMTNYMYAKMIVLAYLFQPVLWTIQVFSYWWPDIWTIKPLFKNKGVHASTYIHMHTERERNITIYKCKM